MDFFNQTKPIEILLVEDNPGDALLASEALKRSKVKNNLAVVEDGVKALEYLRKQGEFAGAPTPDLILLDLNLPKKDGREALAEIKGDGMLKRIPVVVLTASRAERDMRKAYDLHANCFITKPDDLDQYSMMAQSIEDFWLTIVKLPPREECP